MSKFVALCTECDHVWETRNPPDEIEQPRCSECNATGHSIRFERAADVVEAVQRSAQEPELVREARRDRRWHEVRQRINEYLDRLERTAPDDSDHTAAREVRGAFWELNKLLQEINDRGPGISLEELHGVSDRLDEIEAEIEEEASDLETVDTLRSRIRELHTRIAELDTEEEKLSAKVRKRRHDLKIYSIRLKNIEDEKDALEEGQSLGYEMGWNEAEDTYRIQIPCVKCGKEMVMMPGSEMHNAAIRALQASGWGHQDCHTDGWVSHEDFSAV